MKVVYLYILHIHHQILLWVCFGVRGIFVFEKKNIPTYHKNTTTSFGISRATPGGAERWERDSKSSAGRTVHSQAGGGFGGGRGSGRGWEAEAMSSLANHWGAPPGPKSPLRGALQSKGGGLTSVTPLTELSSKNATFIDKRTELSKCSGPPNPVSFLLLVSKIP